MAIEIDLYSDAVTKSTPAMRPLHVETGGPRGIYDAAEFLVLR